MLSPDIPPFGRITSDVVTGMSITDFTRVEHITMVRGKGKGEGGRRIMNNPIHFPFIFQCSGNFYREWFNPNEMIPIFTENVFTTQHSDYKYSLLN